MAWSSRRGCGSTRRTSGATTATEGFSTSFCAGCAADWVPSADPRIVHHDLCFGCGQANQGPPGYAHGGVMAAALDEAMALLLFERGTFAVTGRLEVDLVAPVPVGTFVRVSASLEREGERTVELSAHAVGEDGRPLAAAKGTFVRVRSL